MTLRTLNYGNYGIFLIVGHAGFCPSAESLDNAGFCGLLYYNCIRQPTGILCILKKKAMSKLLRPIVS